MSPVVVLGSCETVHSSRVDRFCLRDNSFHLVSVRWNIELRWPSRDGGVVYSRRSVVFCSSVTE